MADPNASIASGYRCYKEVNFFVEMRIIGHFDFDFITSFAKVKARSQVRKVDETRSCQVPSGPPCWNTDRYNLM